MSVEIDVDVVNFTTGGWMDKLADGSVRINASSAGQTGAELIINPEGIAYLKGKTLATTDYVDSKTSGVTGDYATKSYVTSSIQSATANLASKGDVSAAVQGLASTAYVDQKVAAGAQGLATQQYVLDAIQSKVVQMFKDGQNLAQAGYQKLPGGLILQWAIVTVWSGQGFTWTYPAAFPNAAFCAFGNAMAGSPGTTADRTVQPVSAAPASCSFATTYNGGGMNGPTAHMLFAVGY